MQKIMNMQKTLVEGGNINGKSEEYRFVMNDNWNILFNGIGIKKKEKLKLWKINEDYVPTGVHK